MSKLFIVNPDTGELIETNPGTPNGMILAERQAALDLIEGPKVGDYLRTRDNRLLRFTIDNDESLQAYDGGSWYLGPNGCDFSGACGDSYPVYRLFNTGQRKAGRCWFFSNDVWKAHNGVNVAAMFNVWEELPDVLLTTAQWKRRAKDAAMKMKRAYDCFGYNSILASAVYLPRHKYPEHWYVTPEQN